LLNLNHNSCFIDSGIFGERGEVLKIHKYQVRELFRKQHIPVSDGYVATSPEDAASYISEKVRKPVVGFVAGLSLPPVMLQPSVFSPNT
jgi:hypothetical protein